MYLNKAILIGNLTRDPEIKAIPSGTKVATFGIATNRVWKDKNGVKQENVDFHNIVVFGRQAEIVGQYMKKGSSILIEGRIQTRSWDDAAGVKKYRTEIVADRIQFGPRPAGGGGYSAPAPAEEDNKKALDTIEYPEEEINPDDIPF
ncbi:MAG: single-stranded DNA-binding protein [Candidatus Zambryskibacteria bacterium RIFCSPLOWO2_12_FULL_39_45]|uniref:Single-stranded DNA-binding protein n=3 Tax=Candidatus Zambryskiibacteriota TaxID=1817925 RepID=A0A1G2T8W9_9BACT|nr:MAG: Single-stranded DNA-binding protein [Parcubacteria group bacterium GW2011_GWA2_40_14]OHA93727.1 MAG: single-stranded DNA-binding protein [Candidatus Zambryskibacteria bacterium RIFCSPHIGHO2_02_38_10.5]OHA95734.1 MAG: single-stranded DNA-binding protein [Candidatus Zambryskibacteria bacterium RIFCSPHIGHO2_02_FULL_39_82]OHA97838.1 MAG: single-stranded DNA-binding protein [Candidatus Zambryskibacteria bacterium RIFCSPHIGHO2_12_FULL_38_37]OHB07826.1 MAG: single-stranded DNA-binding protein 